MFIRLKERKMKQIVYIEKPEAVLYPEGKLTRLIAAQEDFIWLGDRRPLKREDIVT